MAALAPTHRAAALLVAVALLAQTVVMGPAVAALGVSLLASYALRCCFNSSFLA